MHLPDFRTAVLADPRLAIHAEIEATEGWGAEIAVRSNDGYLTTLEAADIRHPAATWERLRGVCLGQVSGHVIYQMSRVVGYFSRTSNWNKSKLGELADRRLGNYAIPNAPAPVVTHARADYAAVCPMADAAG